MNIRNCWLAVLAFSLVSLTATVGAATYPSLTPDKVLILDGHVVHDANQVWSNVTNWGLLGSAYSASFSFSDSPSAQWPPHSGHEYLWAAGLWVGGLVQGEAHVTTGAYISEFRPTDAPGDTIYVTARGAPGGNRFPWANADDDGDGLEDEEILNGLDDDGDGLIDEDFAAIGDQHFICGYDDFEPELAQDLPDHTPLNLQITQQSIQWSSPLAEDFIGYDFTITNVGTETIEQVYLGLFSDNDIGPRGSSTITADDDMAGYISTMAPAADGTTVPVQAAYMYDDASQGRLDGYAGWVLCGHTTDPTGTTAPAAVSAHAFRHFTGNAGFRQGGDPTSDAERYQALSAARFDPNTTAGQAADYRVLLSAGSFPSLAPGQSLSFQVALVLGAGLEDMVANAAEAVATYRGQDFNRDGDPANGNEVTVHWLRAEDVPVAASAGWLTAQRVGSEVQLTIETNTAPTTDLAVVRRGARGVTTRRWAGSDLVAMGAAGNHWRYTLQDGDQTGWPRTYQLVTGDAGLERTLAQVDLDLPRLAVATITASPNPFNPLVHIQIDLPREGPALLQAFDVRGRLVHTLLDEFHAVGRDDIVWQGEDNEGRALASGVYRLRLTTAGQVVEKRVTLVR